MSHVELGVLLIQAFIIAVPTLYIVLVLRMVVAARRFDRHFRRMYPEKANEVTKRWPAHMSKISPFFMFSVSFWENDMPTNETLDALKRKSMRSFFALSLLTILLVLLGLLCARSIEGGGPR